MFSSCRESSALLSGTTVVWLHQADGDANHLALDKFSDPLTDDDGGVTGGPTCARAHRHALRNANISKDSEKHTVMGHTDLWPWWFSSANAHVCHYSVFLVYHTTVREICEAIWLCERAHSWLCNIFIGPSGNSGCGHSNSIIASQLVSQWNNDKYSCWLTGKQLVCVCVCVEEWLLECLLMDIKAYLLNFSTEVILLIWLFFIEYFYIVVGY